MGAVFFELKTNDNRDYVFHLIGDGGEILLFGGEYPDKGDAEKDIGAVRVGSLMSQQIAAGRTKSGEMFFVIKDGDGQIIAKSALYPSQMQFDNALHRVKDNACVAEISDLT